MHIQYIIVTTAIYTHIKLTAVLILPCAPYNGAWESQSCQDTDEQIHNDVDVPGPVSDQDHLKKVLEQRDTRKSLATLINFPIVHCLPEQQIQTMQVAIDQKATFEQL